MECVAEQNIFLTTQNAPAPHTFLVPEMHSSVSEGTDWESGRGAVVLLP